MASAWWRRTSADLLAEYAGVHHGVRRAMATYNSSHSAYIRERARQLAERGMAAQDKIEDELMRRLYEEGQL